MIKEALSTVVVVAVLTAMTTLPATAISSTYLLPSYRAAGVTPSQEAQIRALMKPVDDANNLKLARVASLTKELHELLQQDEPDITKAAAKQAEIDRLKGEIDSARSKLMIAIRSLLTPEQRDKLLYDKFLAPYRRLVLTTEQQTKVREILRKQITDTDPWKTKILNLELECRKLELDPKADQAAVMQRQTQINQLNAQIKSLELATSIAIRNLLNAEQVKKLYPSSSPADSFSAAKPTPEQIAKINSLTRSYSDTSTALAKKLFPLMQALSDLLAKSDLDEKTILSKQQEVNSLRSEMTLAKAKLICDFRAVFTPEQVHLLVGEDTDAYRPLDLTAAQKERLDLLTAQYRKDGASKQQALFNRQLDFDTLAGDPRANEKEIMDAQSKVNETQAEIDSLKRQFTLSVRGHLTQEQLDKLAVNSLLRNKLDTSTLNTTEVHKLSDTITRFRNEAIDKSARINDVTSALRDLAWQPMPDEKLQSEKDTELNALQSAVNKERTKLMVDLHNILKQTAQANTDVDVFDLTK